MAMDLVDGDKCAICGATFPQSWKRPIRCNHKHPGRDWSQRSEPSVEPLIHSHWTLLHQYPVERWNDWEAQAAVSWFVSWRSRIPNYGCDYRKNFSAYLQSNPPAFASADSFFQWTVEAHNFVSLNHVQPPKPTLSLVEARQVYGVPANI